MSEARHIPELRILLGTYNYLMQVQQLNGKIRRALQELEKQKAMRELQEVSYSLIAVENTSEQALSPATIPNKACVAFYLAMGLRKYHCGVCVAAGTNASTLWIKYFTYSRHLVILKILAKHITSSPQELKIRIMCLAVNKHTSYKFRWSFLKHISIHNRNALGFPSGFYWTGCQDIAVEDKWKQDSPPYCPVDRVDWMPGQPDNSAGIQNCCRIKHNDMVDDQPCFRPSIVICQIRLFDDDCHLCPEPPQVQNGKVTVKYVPNPYSGKEWRNPDAKLEITCDNGYALVPNEEVACIQNSKAEGEWNKIPQCKKLCPLLSLPHGQVAYSSDQVTEGVIAHFSCSTNYVIDGPTLSVCSSVGFWSNPIPTCTGKVCNNMCSVEYGMDRPFGDLYGYVPNSNRWSSCCSMCNNNADCVGWVDVVGVQNSCFLKSAITASFRYNHARFKYTMGIKQGSCRAASSPPIRVPTCTRMCGIKKDMDQPLSDEMDDEAPILATWEDCCYLCNQDANCRGWTFHDRKCRRKKELHLLELPRPGVILGVKEGNCRLPYQPTNLPPQYDAALDSANISWPERNALMLAAYLYTMPFQLTLAEPNRTLPIEFNIEDIADKDAQAFIAIAKKYNLVETSVEHLTGFVAEAIRTRTEEALLCAFRRLATKQLKILGFDWRAQLLRCQFNGLPCDLDGGMLSFYDSLYGRCFTLNTNSSNLWAVSQPGEDRGLFVILDTTKEEYVFTETTEGFKLYIHSQSVVPLLDNLGYYLPSNTWSSIVIKKATTKRLSAPYGDCVSKYPSINLWPTYEYSLEACYRTCFQELLLERCGCGDPRLPLPLNKTGCDPSDKCFLLWKRKTAGFSNTSSCNCQLPCQETFFPVTTISYAKWTDDMRKNCITGYNRTGDCESGVKDGQLLVMIHFADLVNEIITETILVSAVSFVSECSKELSLFIGCSVIGICELLVFVISTKTLLREKGSGDYKLKTLS